MTTYIIRLVRVVSLAAAALLFAEQSQAQCKTPIECALEEIVEELQLVNKMLFDMDTRIRLLLPLLNSDLFPHTTEPTTPIGTEYCMLTDGDGDGRDDHIQVHVANGGTLTAGPSATRVRFDVVVGGVRQYHDEVVATPSIPGGQTRAVDVRFPATCFMVKEHRGNCEFMIDVDFLDAVNETMEYNNSVRGTCLAIK